jgi:hypothetical protein
MSQGIPMDRGPLPSQSTISQEQGWPLAYFPKGDRSVVSRDGVFVPSVMFGQSPDLLFVTQAGANGPETVVFPRPGAAQSVKAPGREAVQRSEQHWLTANRPMFVGQWVALSGERLLAAGSNASEVYTKARALGVAVPFVAYIDPDDHLPFAGW